MLALWKKSYDQPRQHIQKQRHYFVNKGPSSQGYGFSSGHVWMWELDCEESWAPKKWSFWTVVLEKTPEGPLDCKEIQPVHYEGDQSWDFFGRNDAKAETPVLWPPHVKSWLIGKDSDSWRDWGQEEKGEGDDRGWDGWMALPTWWTWVKVNSGCWWWTRRPGVLWFMGSQRVGHNWATELNWTDNHFNVSYSSFFWSPTHILKLSLIVCLRTLMCLPIRMQVTWELVTCFSPSDCNTSSIK